MKLASAVVAIMMLAWVSYSIGFLAGQSDVRRTTVVSAGRPYYDGVYYGQCKLAILRESGLTQFCATDSRTDASGNVK